MSLTARGLECMLEFGLHGRRPGLPPPFRPERVRRILVVRKDNIGDVLCTTPALRALRRALPEARLAILVAEHCRAAVQRNPDLDEVLTYTKAKHRPGFFGAPALWELTRVIRDLRGRRFDLAIAMGRPCSRSGAWLAYATGATWRLGYATPALHPFPFFLNVRGDPGAMLSHEVDACLDLLEAVGVPAAGRELTLVPDPQTVTAVRGRLVQGGAVEAAGLALIHISNRRETSRWPLASFAETADRLRDQLGLSIVLSWAPGGQDNPLFPGDDGKAEEVAKQMRVKPLLLRTSELGELIAALSLCDFVLSTDGGVMHIAAALDVPQVVLFGKTGLSHWAPISEKSIALRKTGRVDQISVDEVLAAATNSVIRWGRNGAAVAAGSREPRA